MPKKIVIYLTGGGDPIPVEDAALLYPEDEVEWVSGGLDVTLTFPQASIFGQTQLSMPPFVSSATLKVQAGAPASQLKLYEIVENITGHIFRRAGDPRMQPVMIFGP